MREYTNLSWPDTPFGSVQRPFGGKAHLLAAFAVEWTTPARQALTSAAAVYVRVVRGRTVHLTADTFDFGFRAIVSDHDADTAAIADLVDGWLVQARRHADIVTGRNLADDLTALLAVAGATRHAGVAGVLAAWAHPDERGRGIARMLDVDPLAAVAAIVGPAADGTARNAVCAAASVALAAGAARDLLTWDGTFDVAAAVEATGWDALAAPTSRTLIPN